MRLALTTLTISLALMAPVYAQENEAAADVDAGAEQQSAEESSSVVDETADEAEAIDDPELDDLELDEQGFDPTEEDDFRPSEDIQSDKSIAFPTDI